MNAIECDRVECSRSDWNRAGPSCVRGFSTALARGSVTGFHGSDGCGKGLLLNVLGLLEKPDSGTLVLLGENTVGLCEKERTVLRNQKFGYLFRHPYLLPSFTVAENVAVPLFRIRAPDAEGARERTMAVLEFAGVAGFESQLAGRLAPRERWRAAFARALVHGPEILVGISPPPEAALLPLARRAADEFGVTVVWAGEKAELAPVADRLFEMNGGVAREIAR